MKIEEYLKNMYIHIDRMDLETSHEIDENETSKVVELSERFKMIGK